MAAGRRRARRVSLPGVAELLRPAVPGPDGGDERQATGRETHAQKITVYLSVEELLDLEHARLAMRRFGLAVDRGRLVREAIAVLLADLDARGKESLLARRIRVSDSTNGTGTSGNAPGGNGAGGIGAGGNPAATNAARDGETAGQP